MAATVSIVSAIMNAKTDQDADRIWLMLKGVDGEDLIRLVIDKLKRSEHKRLRALLLAKNQPTKYGSYILLPSGDLLTPAEYRRIEHLHRLVPSFDPSEPLTKGNP